MEAEVTQRNALGMQVCVPAKWTDEEVKSFAESSNPCGTTNGWSIRREGDKMLIDMPERNPCGRNTGYVHIMLDA